MPEISVIVPIYKVEKYLKQCVYSIINQTFSDIEIILIDDGSPDNCGKMCDEFGENDDRIITIHKKNGGLSDARNAGIAIAKGKYIAFVDSDDYIANTMYEQLYNDIINNNADISVCGVYKDMDEKLTVMNKNTFGLNVYNKEQAIESVLSGTDMIVAAWNKLYKKELFDLVKYPKDKTAEDAFIIIELFLQCNKVVYNYTPQYYYRVRPESITTCLVGRNDYFVVEAYKHNLDLISENTPNLYEVAFHRYIWAYKYIIERCASDFSKSDIRRQLIKFCKAAIGINFKQIFRNKYTTRKEKLIYIIILILPTMYMKINYHRLFKEKN